MNQRGFTLLHIVIGVLFIGLVGIFIYSKQTSITKSPEGSKNQSQATPSASVTSSSSPTTKVSPSLLPAKSPIPKPSSSLRPTSSPTPTSTQAAPPSKVSTTKKNTCEANVIYAKLGGGASNPLFVTLVYSFTSSGSGNVYMTGAQWDFDGDGNWDTDMKQSNGTMEHTYSSGGNYNVKLRLQASDGSTTDICSKSVTVPSGVTVRVTGRIYADVNCNNFPEPDEKGVANAPVRISKLPEHSIYAELNTDGNGNFNFSQNIQLNDSLSVSVNSGVVPEGYKSNPKFTAPNYSLGGSQTSMNLDIPIVPIDSINAGACSG